MGQVAHAVFDGFPLGVLVVSIVTGFILILAANTAFNGFPVLGSILAKDGWLPRQLHTRGDRLAFSNGILILAGAAVFLIVLYDAEVTKLIQLYIVGVFVSFTLSQIGMIRHWNRHLRLERDRQARRRMQRSRVINAVGATMSGTVLVVVLVTKFVHGAGYAIAAMVVLFFLMLGIHRHYDRVRDELRLTEADDADHQLPGAGARHRPRLEDPQADAARPRLRQGRGRPSSRRSRSTSSPMRPRPCRRSGTGATSRCRSRPWTARSVRSPARWSSTSRPSAAATPGCGRRLHPRVRRGRWYEQLLHNQSALRLKGRLLFTPGVMVASVPWQLHSSEGQEERFEGPSVGAVRRGE